jgi:hypothetical protein
MLDRVWLTSGPGLADLCKRRPGWVRLGRLWLVCVGPGLAELRWAGLVGLRSVDQVG